MRRRILRATHASPLLVLLVVLTTVGLAQTPSDRFDPTRTNPDEAVKAAADRARSEAALKDWTAPQTPWGTPDLSGYWLLSTYTPLQRPVELANKPFYTEEEAVAVFRKAVEGDAEANPNVVHYDWKEYGMEAWQAGANPNLRTSLIVDPADGRLPPLT
ncbi:MAG: hypothetical protein FJW14_16240, partial [Acidimicrobiia bacterium]|nr:hypothetical protein [Acidimicrobiia bacterium]